MPYYFSTARTPIQLDEAPNEVGIRFASENGTTTARAAVRTLLRDASTSAPSPPRQFGRFLLLHDAGAASAPVSTVVNALPRALALRIVRTMPVFIERESRLKLVATDQILVSFKQGAPARLRRMLLKGLDLAIVGKSEFDASRLIVAPTSVRRSSRTLDLANQLVAADDVVAYAAPNFLAEVRKRSVNDPRFGAQWHLNNTGRGGGKPEHDVRAIKAWAMVGGGDRSIVIAIIDDGVDLNHPDLKANLWNNPVRGARDRHGRNFVDDHDRYNPAPTAFSAPFDDTNTNDIHGTPCAGVAAAVGNNRRGGAGIAWRCRIMSVKILAGNSLAPSDRIGDAIRYAAQQADVLSCSWEVARHPDIESALAFAVTRGRKGRGSVVCAAAGNENLPRLGFPSSDPHVIAVGACNDRAVRARYSNYGAGLAVVAPSGDDNRPGITTTDVNLRGKGYSSGAYCTDFSGTSSATPLVAGVAALVLSANQTLRWTEVKNVLTSTANKIDTTRGQYRRGYSLKYGFGCVDAAAAVKRARTAAHRRAKRVKAKRVKKK